MPIFIDGFSISGYRSFASKEAKLDGLNKVNVIIGQNNSGKSNILRALHEVYPQFIGNRATPLFKLRQQDKPLIKPDLPTVVGIKISSSGKVFNDLIGSTPAKGNDGHVDHIKKLVFGVGGAIWYHREVAIGGSAGATKELDKKFSKQIEADERGWYFLMNALTGKTGGNLEGWKTETVQALDPIPHLQSKCSLIPAIRTTRPFKVSGSSRDGRTPIVEGLPDHSGVDLISDLADLQNPDPDDPEVDKKLEAFETLNELLREVLGNQSAKVEIPVGRTTIIVHLDGKRLTLRSLGTGIEELVIIAAKSTIFHDQIVCIEEPELHLHPDLQRRLMRYLYEKTSNQYFISTHSAHLMNACPCSIYHVRMEAGYSEIDIAITDSNKFSVCSDLGCKASDLLQSNCIIWVEGPSDRTYVKHWLSVIDGSLIEGLHYAIMFYGGRLLSHLTAEDDEITEFIQLQHLNRNVALLMDTDRGRVGERLSATKIRIRKEISKSGGLIWETWGREIENYIPEPLFREAIEDTHSNIANLPSFGRYEKSTKVRLRVKPRGKKRVKSELKNIDKMKIANYVCERWERIYHPELRKEIRQLVEFIHKANLEIPTP